MTKIQCVALCAFLFLSVPSVLRAQTASLTGTVTDATGAVVPDAAVRAQNSATGAEREARTGPTGVYRIADLPAGRYTVTVDKQGFASFRVVDLELTVDQVLTLDAKLEVSRASTTTVEVTGQTVAPINLENASISNIVNQQRIVDLPLITRDPYQLILLSPGVIQSNTSLGGFSANGTRERNNNFLLDGVDNNDTDVPGIASGLNPLNPDSTQEFRVITNNFAPEFGRNNGAIIDVLTKSGTNSVHGDAYWFGRYDALGARDFFNHQPDTPKDPYVRNIFGASAGGPIRKDKTFWFGNYEGQRFITTLTNASSVPNAAFRTGVFSATDPGTGQVTTVDVSTPGSPNNGFGVPLDPTIQGILSHYPLPNGPAVDNATGFLFFPSSSRSTQDAFTVKLDHHLTENNTLSGRYAFSRFRDPDPFHDDFLPGDVGATSTFQRSQNLALDLTSILLPTVVNDLRFGGNRTNSQFNCTGVSLFDSFGGVDSFGRGPDYGLTDPGGSGPATFGCAILGDSNGQARFTGTYQVLDGLTWVKNTHTFKVGTEFRDIYSNSFTDFSSRSLLGFAPFFDFGVPVLQNLPDGLLNDTALEDETAMLLGIVDSQSQGQFFNKGGVRVGDDLRGFRQRELAFYGQDAWKARPNLTLTYGLRWEFYGVPFEVHNNFSNLYTDPSGPAPFTFSIVGPGAARPLYNDQYTNFEPRVGLAWDPFKNGKTSIRAGFGLFHDRAFGNIFGNARSNPPFQESFSANPFVPVTGLPAPTTVPATATVTNLDPNTFLGGLVTADLFDPNFRTPYSENWNFGIQHQLTNSLNLEVNYVGVHGLRLFRQVDGNPPQPGLVSQLETFCKDPNNPFGCVDSANSSTLRNVLLWIGAEIGALPFDAVNNNALVISLPVLSGPGAFLQKSIASSTYNGLQVNLTQRMSHGVQMQVAYTYSHAIDNASDPINPAAGNRAFPRNSFNIQAERGNSDFDVRHRASINFIYEPDIGRGRGHLNSGFAGRILEGWQMSGITTFQSGLPFDVFGNRDSQHTGLSGRANVVGSTAIPAGSDETQTGPPLRAFALAPFDIAPNLGRNVFYGPGVNNWNVNLQKETALTERLKLQLRFEFYNLFNRVQFGQPDNLIADTQSFGLSSSQVGQPDGTTGARQIQFAAKLLF
jgi:Carboxypeptidase regulatory-like domain